MRLPLNFDVLKNVEIKAENQAERDARTSSPRIERWHNRCYGAVDTRVRFLRL